MAVEQGCIFYFFCLVDEERPGICITCIETYCVALRCTFEYSREYSVSTFFIYFAVVYLYIILL